MTTQLKRLLDQVRESLSRSQPPSHFNKAIITTLEHEGGFVNDPVDPGGATNWGISIRYLQQRGDMDGDGWLDGDLNRDGVIDIKDIKNMTVEQAVHLYRTGFWDNHNYDNINNYTIAARVFDMTVNMGAIQAGRIVQRALNNLGNRLTVDGRIGPMTFTAINTASPDRLIVEIRLEHINFYLNLINQRPELGRFRNGWLRRACH